MTQFPGTNPVQPETIAQAYALARRGSWDALRKMWSNDRELLIACSRYRKPGSRWTFLHQAAYFGQEPAIRDLIAVGASTTFAGTDDTTPAAAARRRGHHCIADLIEHAARGAEALWGPPKDPALLPASCLWSEARERLAERNLIFAYAGSTASVPAGKRYYVDSFGRALIGWHGTYNPPKDMGGYSLLPAELRDGDSQAKSGE